MEEQEDKELMLKYSIKDLEQISGIKAHTLRMWEQRYNILKPGRSETNIRAYSNSDLRMLLNISLLNNNGVKISKIAEMEPHEIYASVQELSQKDFENNLQIDNLVIAMVDMDEERFEKAIANNILKIGFDKTINEVIYPFLKKIAVLWITNSINPAQEHFISNLIRQKLISAIDAQMVNGVKTKSKFMLFLPEHELHEISLLYYHYRLRDMNFKSYYLGQSVPFEDLQKVYNVHQPEYLFTIITAVIPHQSLQAYLNHLSSSFPFSTIIISGYQFINQKISYPKNVKTFKDPKEFLDLMDQLELKTTHL
jgi:MerR family transcriptional regulator, light-induced transcriptional regulator